MLTIADPTTEVFVGSLVIFDAADGSAEVGFWVHPDHRGKGIAKGAVTLAVEFAKQSGLTQLRARTTPQNHASKTTLERSGFVEGESSYGQAPSGEEVLLTSYACDLSRS